MYNNGRHVNNSKRNDNKRSSMENDYNLVSTVQLLKPTHFSCLLINYFTLSSVSMSIAILTSIEKWQFRYFCKKTVLKFTQLEIMVTLKHVQLVIYLTPCVWFFVVLMFQYRHNINSWLDVYGNHSLVYTSKIVKQINLHVFICKLECVSR